MAPLFLQKYNNSLSLSLDVKSVIIFYTLNPDTFITYKIQYEHLSSRRTCWILEQKIKIMSLVGLF